MAGWGRTIGTHDQQPGVSESRKGVFSALRRAWIGTTNKIKTIPQARRPDHAFSEWFWDSVAAGLALPGAADY